MLAYLSINSCVSVFVSTTFSCQLLTTVKLQARSANEQRPGSRLAAGPAHAKRQGWERSARDRQRKRRGETREIREAGTYRDVAVWTTLSEPAIRHNHVVA